MTRSGRNRANGEGSIFPYRNGYAAYVWVSTPTGQRRRRWIYGKTREERRGRQIIDSLAEQARAYGHEPSGEAEQRALLETVTNLPCEIIDRVVQPDPATGLVRSEQSRAVTAERARAADLDVATDLKTTRNLDERTGNLTAARDDTASADAATAHAAREVRPWERDFPIPIQNVVASAASTSASATSAFGAGRNPVRGSRLRP